MWSLQRCFFVGPEIKHNNAISVLQFIGHEWTHFDMSVVLKGSPFLKFTKQGMTIKHLEFLTVQHNLLAEECTHPVAWVQFAQIWANISDAPHVQTCHTWDTCQIKNLEFLWFHLWDVLNENVHVKQWTVRELQHLYQRCVPQKVRPTEVWRTHMEAFQVVHVFQSSLRKGRQTWVTHLCMFVHDTLDFLTEIAHEQEHFVVIRPILTHWYLLPDDAVREARCKTRMCLRQVKQWPWVQVSGYFHDDVIRQCQQLKWKCVPCILIVCHRMLRKKLVMRPQINKIVTNYQFSLPIASTSSALAPTIWMWTEQ